MDTTIAPGALPKRRPRAGVRNVRVRLRIWRRSRPFWAGSIALIGGLPMWYFPARAVQFLFVSRTPIWAGILVGVLVEFFALMLLVQPQHRATFGTMIVILSLLSFITSDFGGLFIGMFLGVLGGSLALAWTPVAGKTKRQQKWLMKSRGQKPAILAAAAAPAAAAPAAAPERMIVLDEPARADASVRQPEIIEPDEIPVGEAAGYEVFGWEAPPIPLLEPEPIVDVTETSAESGSDASEPAPDHVIDLIEPAIDIAPVVQEDEVRTQTAPEGDLQDRSIDVRDRADGATEGSPTIDLREERASTAPAQNEVDDRSDRPE